MTALWGPTELFFATPVAALFYHLLEQQSWQQTATGKQETWSARLQGEDIVDRAQKSLLEFAPAALGCEGRAHPAASCSPARWCSKPPLSVPLLGVMVSGSPC